MAGLTCGQLTLWKGVSAATGPSITMGCGTSVPRAATSHSGRAPATKTPACGGPEVWSSGLRYATPSKRVSLLERQPQEGKKRQVRE